MQITKTRFCRTRALLLIALLLFELLSVCFQIHSNAVSNIQSYDDTLIEDDMVNMVESEYPFNSFGEPSIVGFTEYCYSENTAYSAFYGLYVYVYNPTEKPLIIREGRNQVSLSSSFGSDGKRSSVDNYGLTYLDNTDNYRFYKFKITNSQEQYSLV